MEEPQPETSVRSMTMSADSPARFVCRLRVSEELLRFDYLSGLLEAEDSEQITLITGPTLDKRLQVSMAGYYKVGLKPTWQLKAATLAANKLPFPDLAAPPKAKAMRPPSAPHAGAAVPPAVVPSWASLAADDSSRSSRRAARAARSAAKSGGFVRGTGPPQFWGWAPPGDDPPSPPPRGGVPGGGGLSGSRPASPVRGLFTQQQGHPAGDGHATTSGGDTTPASPRPANCPPWAHQDAILVAPPRPVTAPPRHGAPFRVPAEIVREFPPSAAGSRYGETMRARVRAERASASAAAASAAAAHVAARVAAQRRAFVAGCAARTEYKVAIGDPHAVGVRRAAVEAASLRRVPTRLTAFESAAVNTELKELDAFAEREVARAATVVATRAAHLAAAAAEGTNPAGTHPAAHSIVPSETPAAGESASSHAEGGGGEAAG